MPMLKQRRIDFKFHLDLRTKICYNVFQEGDLSWLKNMNYMYWIMKKYL